jgi:transcriptional regulator with XRE-family HTH domain
VVLTLPHGNLFTTPSRKIDNKNWKGGIVMFGEFIKERRIEKSISLREFCKRVEIDASNWSKVERGLLAPPQDEERLRKIARALDIKFGSALWKEMKDKANIDAGIIPEDILSDEKVLNSLPIFFRTIRSENPTPEDLDKLINMIRKD